MTPSDQADTGSAPGSATIPPQRSAHALRLLVLGSGDSAGALRSRAADAGAELAQRFSSRVTHVVVDDTVGEDDARVVRARAAGLPVLDLAQGDELLGSPGEEAAPAVSDAYPISGEPETAQEPQAEAEPIEDTEPIAGAEPIEDTEPIALIRPRSEYAAESADGGPANVFAGSALEAVLLFPPLPVDETAATCGCGEACGGDGAAVLDLEEEPGQELSDGHEARLDASAVSPGTDSIAAQEEAGISALLPSAQSPVAAAGSVAWALVPLASLGLLTPVAMGYGAYRLRSRPLAAATALYAVAVVTAFAVSAAAPHGGGTRSAAGELLTACLATSWLGGTVHSFLIRRRVFG